ncbi:BTAD domain-containing putative transcriptional regulator [Deinococcus roseus]|uniref:Transcriptional activator n=1 Tax=Deinococcus roseus TaxID=392414 RepID=A0ABQ2CVX6_9DEIO|nr:BTAD domain-containing putative transcriptional regulator [Deinococcus roseus]GGJ26128.1 transcriptional activator [Deinococcus roseus]
MNFDLQMLGYPHFRGSKLPPHKPVALLLHLACRQEWVSREELSTLFWPDTDTPTARHNLRILLHRTRQLSWVEGLEQDAQHLRWQVSTDVQQFRQAFQQGQWQEAVQLHNAPLLEGFVLEDIPGLQAWCDIEQEALLCQWQKACLQLAAQLGMQQKHADAAQVLGKLLVQDPLSETALQKFLEALYLSGQRSEALKAYENFRQHLQLELGLEPLQHTQNLLQIIRTAEPLPVPHTEVHEVPLEVQRPPKLVGRTQEQLALLQARTPLVLVSGEPGVGKTRLLEDMFPQARWLRCREGLENLPYFPLLEVLRQGNLPDLGPYLQDLARLLPEVHPAPLPPADPFTLKPRLLEALRLAFQQGSGPLIIDDLQWADAATLEWISYLLRTGSRQVVGSYRQQEVAAELQKVLSQWKSAGQLTLISLSSLTETEIQRLMADLTHQQEGPPLFSHWLHQHSGGNAFFALETLKALFQGHILRIEGQDWRTDLDHTTRDYSELQVPTQVKELIARRLKNLPDLAFKVAQAASVLGQFLPEVLSKMLKLPEWDVLDQQDVLLEAGLLKDQGFAHDLIRQTLQASLASGRRRMLHAAAATQLQNQTDDLLVAGHWRAANHMEEAWTLEIHHAAKQIQRGLLHDGLNMLQRLAQELPEPHPLRLEALLISGTHLHLLNMDDADQALEQTLKHPALTPDLHFRALLSQVDNAVYRGDMPLAKIRIETAAQLIHPDQTPSALRLRFCHARLEVLLRSGQFAETEQFIPQVYLQHGQDSITRSYEAQLLYYQGKYRQAADLFERMRQEDPDCIYILTLENDLGVNLWMLGNLQQAEQELQQSLKHWTGSPHVEALSHMHLGFVRLSQGRFSEALHCMDQARIACQMLGSLTFEADIEQRTGVIYSHAGRFQEAHLHLQKSLHLLEQVGDPYRMGITSSLLALTHAMLGDAENAEQQLAFTATLLQQHPSPLGELFLLQTQGILQAQKGHLQNALSCFQHTEKLSRLNPFPEFLVMNLLGQAALHQNSQDLLQEALEISECHGFKRLEWQAAHLLNRTTQAAEALHFLKENSPAGWFY